MYLSKTTFLTAVAMLAFAANSLLCRLALKSTSIDPGTFTAVRLASAATVLWLIASTRKRVHAGSWGSAIALFIYATAFSFSYVELHAGVGALLLFGAVQVTMTGHGFWHGERLRRSQLLGIALAVIGLVVLLLPRNGESVRFAASGLMLAAGVAWGVYSLRGRGIADPIAATRDNFIRTMPFAAALIVVVAKVELDVLGVLLATTSGAITSGAGYAIWYSAVRCLTSTQAATVQLSVPVITALLAFLYLGEALTELQILAAVAVLGGVGLAMLHERKASEIGSNSHL